MERITGTKQNYAWGSQTLLSTLRGLDASEDPEAEIWYGAHPDAPSTLGDHSTLLDHISADPDTELGEAISSRYDGRLPFLLKLLAASSPLSIQAHPSDSQANAGFAREESEGVDRNAPERLFRDNRHKPELIVAVSAFEALAGFRFRNDTADLFRALGADALADQMMEHGPLAIVEWLLRPPAGDADLVATTIETISAGAAEYSGDKWSAEAELLRNVSETYPGDPGIGVAAILNRITLTPGEGLYLDACTLHAYVGGLGIEVMANSNNVLRGGLTPKHVDVDALLDVLIPDITLPTLVNADENGNYETPADEFTLRRVDDQSSVTGPVIVLTVTGTATVTASAHTETLLPTDAVWLSAGETASITADGTTVITGVS